MARFRPVDKTLQPYVDEAKRKGWEIREGSSHVVLKSPTGEKVTLSRGKADDKSQHARKNLRAEARRKGLIDE